MERPRLAVTVENAVTWPTGGGSIRTGTFVMTACATSTGTPGASFFALREQPPAKIAAVTANAMSHALERQRNFFMRRLVCKVGFYAAAFRRLKRHREFF